MGVQQILKEDLKNFKGDIKITLYIDLINTDIPEDIPEMHIEDYNGKPIGIQAYNTGRTINDGYLIFEGQTEFSFVITRPANKSQPPKMKKSKKFL